MGMLIDLQKQLGIDATIGAQMLIFFFVYVWLRFVFFGPFLSLLELRHSSTEGLREKAIGLDAEAEEKEKLYAERLAAARKAAALEREKILAAARAESSSEIERARGTSKKQIESAREKNEADAASSLKGLSSQTEELSELFVEKLTNARVGL